MIYSFHHFYYWSKGGVETGMAYRAKIFRALGLEAKFVFATTFPNANIQHEMQMLGFLDSEVIWMYGFFSDCRISPVTYRLKQLENTFGGKEYAISGNGDVVKYVFPGEHYYYQAYLASGTDDAVHRVEIISNDRLIRKDYYTYCKIYSEYYTPMENYSHLYLRRFFNEDGTVAYEEVMGNEAMVDDVVLYKFPDRLIYSREELAGYMMSRLNLTGQDVVLIDGEPGKIHRSAFILNAFPAKVGFILHADHYICSDEEHVFWYRIYEYALSHPEKIDFYVTNTEAQSALLREQFKQYKEVEPLVVTLPAAGLDELKYPKNGRRRHALISAGRLAPGEKNMNWVIEAAVEARKSVPDLTLDIYGEGEEEGRLRDLIRQLECGDYVHLCGFQKLDEVYQEYEAYVSASWSETFGVTLLEAVGSGLPIVGFDSPYGMQTFVDEGENGYRVPVGDVDGLGKGIIRLFTEADMEGFRQHSYEKASGYLMEAMEKKWENVLGKMK